jgi:pyruvate dehydrogenase E1 component
MDPLFKEVGIYSALGQLYEPVDSNLLLSYREATDGQVLEEGITEAGSSASFQAAGTAYSTHGEPMIPLYIFYSMFGFQRTGDEFWAFADARGRGFLLGGTAGRTTLNGEGLQHEDGHSLVLASVIPTIRAYDPAFAYETAVLIRDGINRMYGDNPEDVLYYLTLYNENYAMPARPDGVSDEDITRGLYMFRAAPEIATPSKDGSSSGNGSGSGNGRKPRQPLAVTLLAGGSIMQQALRAQQMLAERGVAADVWSATSYQLLRREALETMRWNYLHPDQEVRLPLVSQLLAEPAARGPIVAVSDFVTDWPDMISRWVPGNSWASLGTDGFGRSDTREALRRFFQIDAENITAAALSELARAGRMDAKDARRMIGELGLAEEEAFAVRA